jgi:glycosidase
MEKWYDNAVFYHIYPLGLCGAEKENDGVTVTNRLEGLEEWIHHMVEIGCNALYIGPLFESVGHGYETTDYKLVDRRLGSNEAFTHFVKNCHENGIKVVVDGVFNHTGRSFFAFEDIKQNREKSIYRDWYCNVNFQGNNEYNDGFSYESWRGYNVLAKLNQRNPQVKQYIFEVIRFWVEEFDIDGIRLDCADVLDFDFMKEMRSFCNHVKQDFWLMGEVIHGDYSRWVNEDTLHSVTNYELHKAFYSAHNDHNYFEIAHTVKRLFDPNGGLCRQGTLYSFVDNHDVDRIYSKLNSKEHLYPVHILLFTLPGIPSIYYGSEFAIEGRKDNRSDDAVRPFLTLSDYRKESVGDGTKHIDYPTEHGKLTELISILAGVRKESKELQYGLYKELFLTNRQYAFARIFNNRAVITAVNNDDSIFKMSIPLPIEVKQVKNLINGEEIEVVGNRIELEVNGNDGVVLLCV